MVASKATTRGARLFCRRRRGRRSCRARQRRALSSLGENAAFAGAALAALPSTRAFMSAKRGKKLPPQSLRTLAIILRSSLTFLYYSFFHFFPPLSRCSIVHLG